jgi:hypothetical protein
MVLKASFTGYRYGSELSIFALFSDVTRAMIDIGNTSWELKQPIGAFREVFT